MVFFHNINPGARVQVKWRGEIESGTIRYAGSLVAKDGDWVGVELDNAGNVAVNTNPKAKFCIAHFFGSKYMFFSTTRCQISRRRKFRRLYIVL